MMKLVCLCVVLCVLYSQTRAAVTEPEFEEVKADVAALEKFKKRVLTKAKKNTGRIKVLEQHTELSAASLEALVPSDDEVIRFPPIRGPGGNLPLEEIIKWILEEMERRRRAGIRWGNEITKRIEKLEKCKNKTDEDINDLKDCKEKANGRINNLEKCKKKTDDDIKDLKECKKKANEDIKDLKACKKKTDGRITALEKCKKDTDKKIKDLEECVEKLKKDDIVPQIPWPPPTPTPAPTPVPTPTPAPTGGWSEWGEWFGCSNTCGTGVRERERECLSGNNQCPGPANESGICNREPCP